MGNWRTIGAISLAFALAFISMPLLGAVVAEDNAQWPMSHYDKGNTNRCPYDAAGNDGELLWSRNFNDERIGKPVIGTDGTLYVTSSGGGLIAISSDGDEKWKFSGPSDVMEYSYEPVSAAIGQSGCIFFVTGSEHYDFYPNGSIYAVWPNGTLRWSDHLGAPVLTAPLIDDQGNILIVISKWIDAYNLGFSELRCYDEEGGVEWSFSPPSANGSVFSEPASSSNGTVFITTYLNDNATLWAIGPGGDGLWNRSIPSSMWNQESGSYSDLGVSVDDDGSIYLTIGDMLRALDPSGQERWNYSGISGYNGVAIGEEHLFVVDGAYVDILKKDGERIATYFAWGRVLNTPTVVQGDNVILTTWFRGVHMVNATGVEVWDYPLDDAAANGAVVDDQGTIYFVLIEGQSTPAIIAVGDRDLQTDILAWDAAWMVSIAFATAMLSWYVWTINRRAKDEADGLGAEVGLKDNRKLALALRVIGALMMLAAVLVGSWALYGPYSDEKGLFEIMNAIPLASLLAVGYVILILASALHPKFAIGQFVMMALITVAMLLSDPLQTVQGDPNDGWVPYIGFVLAWLGTGIVLLSGHFHDPEMEV